MECCNQSSTDHLFPFATAKVSVWLNGSSTLAEENDWRCFIIFDKS
jgi:hypothetical protein